MNKYLLLLLLGISSGFIIIGSFYIGAYKVCENSEGTLIKGWKCNDIEVVIACETIEGQQYKITEEFLKENKFILNMSTWNNS